jgi:serine protease inhibitor
LQKTNINIPTFSFDADYKPKPTLIALVMTQILDPSCSDFSRMATAPSRIDVYKRVSE